MRRGGDGERSQHLPQRAGPALLPGVLLGGPDQEGQGQDQEEEERQEVTDNAMQILSDTFEEIIDLLCGRLLAGVGDSVPPVTAVFSRQAQLLALLPTRPGQVYNTN